MPHRKEQYSLSFFKAIASAAGFNTGFWQVDNDSIDFQIGARGGQGTLKSPRIEVQAKCSSQDIVRDGGIHFALPIKNYNDLCGYNWHVPRILVILLIPEKPSDWIHQTQEGMTLRRCAYWISLKEAPVVKNRRSVTVPISCSCVFTVDALQGMLLRVASGGYP